MWTTSPELATIRVGYDAFRRKIHRHSSTRPQNDRRPRRSGAPSGRGGTYDTGTGLSSAYCVISVLALAT